MLGQVSRRIGGAGYAHIALTGFFDDRSAERLGPAIWLSTAKLVLHPLLVAATALLIFGVEPYAAGVMIAAASLPVAGNAFDQCIAQYVQEKFNIAIGPLTAEALKKQVACCTKSEFEGVMEIRGHSWETNLPARRLVYTRDLYLPVQELAARIAATARNVLESTPPELAADVAKNGILLTGGGSMLRGLAGYIAGELHVDVAIAPDPINCVARGTAASLTLGQYLTAGFRDATPRAWHNRLQSPEGFSN